MILSWVSIFVSSLSNRYSDMASPSRAAFSFFTTLSIFAGVYLVRKTDMPSYSFHAWSLISTAITISLIFASELWFLIAACLLGILYGNFLLAFFTVFGESTKIEERGRVGGSIGSISILVMSFLTVVSFGFGFAGSVVLCTLLSICPFVTIWLCPIVPVRLEEDKAFSFRIDCWLKRDFFLYLMPWLIYNFVNAILGRYGTALLTARFQVPIVAMVVLSNAISCIGALVGGFVADMYGRKEALGIGLASYGVSTAFSGLIFLEQKDGMLVFLLCALNGLSWGIFLVLYFFVIWGDLSNMDNNLLNYVGIGVYPLSMSLAQYLPPSVQFPLVNLALASCVLIFSSNAFLAAAQELLSPESRKEFNIFVYLEQLKMFLKKHHRRSK